MIGPRPDAYYYIHQVGFHTYAAYDRDTEAHRLLDAHVALGKTNAYKAAFTHYLRRYKFTIYELSDLENLILQQFLRSTRRRLNADKIKSSVAHLSGESEESVRDAMWGLRNKSYLRWRKGDKSLALQDALLRPFLTDKLRVRHQPRPKKLPPSQSDGQLDMF